MDAKVNAFVREKLEVFLTSRYRHANTLNTPEAEQDI
jgi:hypothetical protein